VENRAGIALEENVLLAVLIAVKRLDEILEHIEILKAGG